MASLIYRNGEWRRVDVRRNSDLFERIPTPTNWGEDEPIGLMEYEAAELKVPWKEPYKSFLITLAGVNPGPVTNGANLWYTFFQRLQGHAELIQGALHPRNLIPRTRIRKLYETLRLLDDRSVHRSVCAFLTRRIDLLQQIIINSIRTFEAYSNVVEYFRADPNQAPPVEDPTRFAFYLERQFYEEQEVGGFHYVDYEICPFRTTGVPEADEEALQSRGATIDLLLWDAARSIPVAAEIKANDDTDCFLALIQALACAVELCSPFQRRRLAIWKGRAEAEPQCGFVVICQQRTPELLSESLELIRALGPETLERVPFLGCYHAEPQAEGFVLENIEI